MSTNVTVKRITKAQRFADILAIVKGEETVPNGSTISDIEAFINHEVELLSHKNSKEGRKMTAAQKENEGFRELILEYLAGEDSGKSCTEIGKAVPELNDVSIHRMSALLKRLVDDGKVVRNVGKGGVKLFSIAEG